ncbi:hypothetical protein ACQKKX_04465 [Neorhizobium sp. NPDC001467]|uniref:hypothetical protein n=1 Tax=Neorhizobium sp. NPDC001467 TaxID=3390595 RepID=UPI003CFE3FB7
MAAKDAKIQTLAPRVDWVEQAIEDLYKRPGGSGTLDEKLWKATLTGAEASATWGDKPWEATDLIYGPTSPNQLSMQQTIFGTSSAGAMKCQDGKGFYGWLFPEEETRWQYPQPQTLANDVFDQPDSGYVHALRTATLSLMAAIFKAPEYVGDYTIIDRINDLATELEELAGQAQEAIGDLQAEIAHQAEVNTTAHEDLQAQIDALRNRLNAGGL